MPDVFGTPGGGPPTEAELERDFGGVGLPEPPAEVDAALPGSTEAAADQGAGGDQTPVAPNVAVSQEPSPTDPIAEEIAARTAEETPPVEETPPEPTAEEKKWAGRFKSPEELEKGYGELFGKVERERGEARALAAEVTEQREALRAIATWIQTQQAAAPVIDPQLVSSMREQGMDDAQIALTIQAAQQIAEGAVAPVKSELEAERARGESQVQVQARQSIVNNFMTKHADLSRETFANVVSTFDSLGFDSYDDQDWPALLELAHDAAIDPSLAEVLTINPNYADTDAGVREAYRLAAERSGRTNGAPAPGNTPAPVPAAAADEAARQQALAAVHVETGGTGVPASSTAGPPPELYDKVLALAAEDRKVSSVFGV